MAAVAEASVMTMAVAGMTEIVAETVPAEARSVALRDVREYPRGMNLAAVRAVPLHGMREEREDTTIIPAFPVMSPAVVMRNRAYMSKIECLPEYRQTLVVSEFFEKGILQTVVLCYNFPTKQ